MNYFEQLAQSFGNELIRPRKYNYSEQILQNFFIDNPQYKYSFHKIINKRSQLLETILVKNWYEISGERQKKVCIVYAHGLGSNKLEVLPILKHFKNYSFDICSFDFSASGKSQGNHTSYGLREQDDVTAVLGWLDQKEKYDQYVLWGRSMGSVAIVLSQGLHLNTKVRCIIIDSPFSSFQKVCLQIASKKSCIPQLFLQPLINYLKQYFSKRVQFNPFTMDIVQKIKKIDRKILFLYSKNDTIVNFSHSVKLKLNCRHIPYEIQIVQDHNMQRSKETHVKIYNFIQQVSSMQLSSLLASTAEKQEKYHGGINMVSTNQQTVNVQCITTRGRSQSRTKGISVASKQFIKQNIQSQANAGRKSTGTSSKTSKINLVITQSVQLKRKQSSKKYDFHNHRSAKFKPVSSIQYTNSYLQRSQKINNKQDIRQPLGLISLNSIDTVQSTNNNDIVHQKYPKHNSQKRQPKKGSFINLIKKQSTNSNSNNEIDFNITQKFVNYFDSENQPMNTQIKNSKKDITCSINQKDSKNYIINSYGTQVNRRQKQKIKSFYSASFMDQNFNMLCSINSICLNRRKVNNNIVNNNNNANVPGTNMNMNVNNKEVVNKDKLGSGNNGNSSVKRPSIQLRRKNRFVI